MNQPKIVSAPTERIKELQFLVQQVMNALGYPGAFVTDRTRVGDFWAAKEVLARRNGATEEEIDRVISREIKTVAERLGVEVGPRDFVWQVAERLKAE